MAESQISHDVLTKTNKEVEAKSFSHPCEHCDKSFFDEQILGLHK